MQPYSENPHYIEFRGRPVLLVGSGEHYGSLLNADFDYIPYLDNLQRHGLNQLRIFSGTYRELPGEFGIAHNTLGPRPEAFLAPWVRLPDGRYDLDTFEPAYFRRLQDFLQQTARREIFVELSLFCFWYNPGLWEASPMHPRNTLRGIGPEDKEKVYTLDGNPLLPYQKAFIRRLAGEMRDFDHVYFEITNEPYSRHDHTAYLDWQHEMADTIVEAEAGQPNQHLIAINYQNRTQRIPHAHEAVSICNFHYALPDAVKENYHLNRVIADDETGFAGQIPDPYRREAWTFFLAGGGIFSHLDYSFTVQHPDGSAEIEGVTPGYGGEDLRGQLSFLRRFLEENEIWKMQPCNEIFGWIAGRVPAQVMGEAGKRYIAYFAENGAGVSQLMGLPAGHYRLDWINPVRGKTFQAQTLDHTGGYLSANLPTHQGDLLVRIEKI